MAQPKQCAVLDKRGKVIKKFNSLSGAKDYKAALEKQWKNDSFSVTDNAVSTTNERPSATFRADGERLTYIKHPDVKKRRVLKPKL